MMGPNKAALILAAAMTIDGLVTNPAGEIQEGYPDPENTTAFNPTHQLYLYNSPKPVRPLDEAALLKRLSKVIFPLKYRDAIAGGHSSTSDRP